MFYGMSGREVLDRVKRVVSTDLQYWVQAADKKPLPQQMRECFDLYRLYRTLPVQYIKHDLFMRTHIGDYRDYVPNMLADAYERQVNPKSALDKVDDKGLWATLMNQQELPVVKTLFHLYADPQVRIERSNGQVVHFDCMLQTLIAGRYNELFLKPRKSSQGNGTARFKLEGQQLTRNGETVSATKFASILESELPYSEYLLQPVVEQHAALRRFKAHTLNTLRIVSYRDDSEFSLVGATLRMGIGDMITDNRCGGGIAVGVDIDTGQLHEHAIGDPSVYGANRRMCHHPDTGIRFFKQTIPFWNEVIDLTRKAAEAVAPLVVVGWDIALTPDGPVLIEGNSDSESYLIQVAGGIRATCLGERLAEHYRWKGLDKTASH